MTTGDSALEPRWHVVAWLIFTIGWLFFGIYWLLLANTSVPMFAIAYFCLAAGGAMRTWMTVRLTKRCNEPPDV